MTPLAVWDARARNYMRICVPVMEYLLSQNIPPVDTYRVEVYFLDVPFARVFTYAQDQQGCRYFDESTDVAAVNAPYDQILTELPPPGLRILDVDLQAGPPEL